MLLVAAALLASALSLSCSVNEYCLNCAKIDAAPGDVAGDATDGGPTIDAPDGGACVVTGVEVCDGKDNDCNGMVDDNIAGLGAACANQVGECAGGVTTCTGGVSGCSKPPMAETCDHKDNNCNGMIDEGDPGGGAACGTNVGECTAGVKHCDLTTGLVECIGAVGTVGGQPELCNGRDDDCDGNFDEGLTNLGSCGGPNVGACHTGTLVCQGGGTVCQNDQGPTFEACDNADNDCDGGVDEDYNKLTDPQNCMTCGNVCMAPHATSGCAGGACTIASCAAGYHNLNGTVADGCEYGPCQADGAEVCDGVDNDCDGIVDNGLTAPAGLCKTVGACTGATAQCMGAAGWKCNYGATVSTDVSGNIIAETKCDTIDNDCDTKVDENQPNKGLACADAGVGVCKGTGTFTCDAANLDGPAVCTVTVPGMASSAEQCDGLDNDCDGLVDDGANTGNLPGQDWVAMGNGHEIMKFEASRPDASALAPGVSTATTCSRTGAIPWTNVTYPQATAACAAIGARLCTEGEWHETCSVVPHQSYPITVPTGTFTVTVEAEDYSAIAAKADTAPNPDVVHAWVPNYTPGFFNVSAMEASPNTGANVDTAARAITDSARLDYALTVTTAGSYRMCVRTYSPAPNATRNDHFWVGVSPTAPGVATNLKALITPTDDAWVWTGPSAAIAVAAGPNVMSVYMQDDGLRIDQVYLTTAATCPANTTPPVGSAGNKWAYQSTPNTFQPGVCNSDELDADLPPATPGDQDDILPSGSLAACFANGALALDVYDLSGNAKEWTAARQPGQNPIRGGSSNNTADGISCPLNFTLADDDFFFPNVGFRCCR
ncbi:MAG: MopE-related protein [Proteobacteria bacterium]|nr:MopE-related protein [Pseudomonadota bacterium]